MRRSLIWSLILLALLSACGWISPAQPQVLPALPTQSAELPAATPELPFTTEASTLLPPDATIRPSQLPQTATGSVAVIQATSTASQVPSAIPSTSTVTPTYEPYLPTPTETLLPPLELPTEQPRAPALIPWTGLPSYPGDSDPGLLFRMGYDPDVWAQTEGNFGEIVLAHRQIEYCTISPWSGRGLPVGWKVEHEFRLIGSVSFDVNTVTAQNVIQFISYVGGDGRVLTGFQVSFTEQRETCVRAAETVFGTLRSFTANPTATPSALPETLTPTVSETASATPSSR